MLLPLLCFFTAGAQHFDVQHFDPEDGLPSREVYAGLVYRLCIHSLRRARHNGELVPIVPVEAAVRTDPNEPFLILKCAVDVSVGEAFADAVVVYVRHILLKRLRARITHAQ